MLSRLCEGADAARNVKRDRDGTWRVKLGARVHAAEPGPRDDGHDPTKAVNAAVVGVVIQ